MKKITFLTFFVLVFSVGMMQAQNIASRKWTPKEQRYVRINGLELEKTYTREQIYEALGQPDSIFVTQEDDRTCEVYKYPNNNVFNFVNGVFYNFVLRDNTYSLDNFIAVGDPDTKIQTLSGLFKFDVGGSNMTRWYPSNDASDHRYDYIPIYFETDPVTRKIICIDGHIIEY